MSKSDPRDILKDIVNGLKNTFSKYDRTARRKAWKAIEKPAGKKLINNLLLNPNRPIVGLPRLLRFKEWLKLEWGNPNDIRGEYWIIDGFIDFADGDVGDRNHEGIAIDHVVGQYTDDVSNLAEELKLPHEIDNYDEVDYEAFINTLGNIREKLEETMSEQQADLYIMGELNCNEETYAMLLGFGDPRMYAMKNEGWIAIRSNNVELFGYNNRRQKEIAESVSQILYEEQGVEESDPSQVELSIYDHKTGKSWYATLQDLEQPEVQSRPTQQLTTTYNKPFTNPKDTEENKYSNPQPSKINPWNTAARKAGLGSELWRGTSESHTSDDS